MRPANVMLLIVSLGWLSWDSAWAQHAISQAEKRKLFADTWEVPGPVKKKDLLHLQYKFDENQVLELRLAPAKSPLASRSRAHS